MALRRLVGGGPVALDTMVFIYFIEDHPRYARLVAPLFDDAGQGDRLLVTSILTLLEVLVVPYRAGNVELAQRYEAVLTRGRGLRLVGTDHHQAAAAAQLRAAYKVHTPDALQLAAALTHRCSTFITNDRSLPAIPGLRVVQLSQLAS